jgi:hypothetical protein
MGSFGNQKTAVVVTRVDGNWNSGWPEW